MQSQKTLMTAEELLRLPDTGHRYELIAGRLVKMPPTGGAHGAVANDLAYYLTAYVLSGQLGRVFAAETGFILRRNPDTVRAPDVAYVAKERLPEGPLPSMFLQLAPDLLAEVTSPCDRPSEVRAKVEDWLRSGVRLLWVVDPATQTVTAFQVEGEPRTFASGDELTADPVLPGFRCHVAELFR